MHDPTEIPNHYGEEAFRGLLRRALAGLQTQLAPPAPDPAIAHQRARYRLNRAQRRAADRQETTDR